MAGYPVRLEGITAVWEDALKALLTPLPLLLLVGCGMIPGTSANLEKRANGILADSLFDAESARYRKLHQASGGSELGNLICGEVNGKNKMGAYIGFRRFVVSEKSRAIAVDPVLSAEDWSNEYTADDDKRAQDEFDFVWPACEGKALPTPSSTLSNEEYTRHIEEQAARLKAMGDEAEKAGRR